MASFVTIEKGLGAEGRIAVVRFDRGDGINALSPEALRQLTDAARSFGRTGQGARGQPRKGYQIRSSSCLSNLAIAVASPA
jgi:hypothetical protein